MLRALRIKLYPNSHAGWLPREAVRVLPQDLQSRAGRERAPLQGDGQGNDEPVEVELIKKNI